MAQNAMPAPPADEGRHKPLPSSNKTSFGFRFVFSLSLLIALCGLLLFYSRSWPFPPWADYAAGETIEIQASWDPKNDLVYPTVRYASNQEEVYDPIVRYEVLRQAKTFITGPSELDGKVRAYGFFNFTPCDDGSFFFVWAHCREYTWTWRVAEYHIENLGGAAETESPLMSAAWQGNLKAVEELLREGADVNARDYLGRTPIWYSRGREVAPILLAAGADIDIKDNEGLTPLMLAASMREIAMVKWLMAAGANLNERSSDGRTALHYAARERLYRQDPPGTETVKLLLEAGASPNIKDNAGNSALILAAVEGQLEEVEALLAAGANVKTRNKSGKSALSIATEKGYAEIAQLLKKHGAPN
ncbi:MAG: ankyrin repeat domain-containing protein [Terriglobia bacterium]